jgi:hypothetical protein
MEPVAPMSVALPANRGSSMTASRSMTEPPMVFEQNNAPAVVQKARLLADWLRTCVGLRAEHFDRNPSRQELHDEQRPPHRHDVLRHDQTEIVDSGAIRDPEDDVRQHFREVVQVIMRQGPVGTDFVLCAVGRMAEDILRTAENSEQDSQFASEWIEYARWVLPGFNGTVAS